MKLLKKASILLLMLTIFAIPTQTAFAAPYFGGGYILDTVPASARITNTTTLFSNPGSGYIRTLYEGNTCKMYFNERSGDYVKVECNGTYGWVYIYSVAISTY